MTRQSKLTTLLIVAILMTSLTPTRFAVSAQPKRWTVLSARRGVVQHHLPPPRPEGSLTVPVNVKTSEGAPRWRPLVCRLPAKGQRCDSR